MAWSTPSALELRAAAGTIAKDRARLCLTFDNMGNAKAVGDGMARGPDELEPGLAVGYPRVVRLLEDLGVRGTFFVEGWNAIHHPDRLLQLARRGHEVALHGWVHERFGDLPAAQAQDIVHKGTEAFRSLGLDPVGFRAPGASRGAHVEPVLASLGYWYDSSDPQPFESREAKSFLARVSVLPSGLAHVGWKPELVDSIQYLRTAAPPSASELQDRWTRAINAAAEAKAMTTLVIHPHVSGVSDERFHAIRSVLEHACVRGDIEICTARTLAARALLNPDS